MKSKIPNLIISIVGITAIVFLEWTALNLRINGVVFSASTALIGTIVGFNFKKFLPQKELEKQS
jgi:hypothetical protein